MICTRRRSSLSRVASSETQRRLFVGEAAARPSQHRDAERLGIFDGCGAIAVDVGDGRVSPDPQTAIRARSQMFREGAVEFGTNDAERGSCVDLDILLRHGGRYVFSQADRGRERRANPDSKCSS